MQSKKQTSKTTINYVAKQGYQLFLMTSRTTGKVAGLSYLVFHSALSVDEARKGIKHAFVKVYLPEEKRQVNVKVPKSWINL